MTKVTLTLEATIQSDGNIYLECPGFDGMLMKYVEKGTDPEAELCMLGVSTMPITPLVLESEAPTGESSVSQIISKSNHLMSEVKRLRSKLN